MFMNVKEFVKRKLFYRQHPDAALRYLPIVDLLKKEDLSDGKILEVGSGSYGISPYLNKSVMGVDTNFDEPEYPLLKQVRASGLNLPFKDNDFDVVIFSDVLEHVPKEKRKKVLEEAVRVAKKAVVVTGPFGKEAFLHDQKLIDYCQNTGLVHPFLKEHLELGLPETGDIYSHLQNNSKVREVKIVGHYLNLKTREVLMKLFVSNNKLVYYFYLKGMMLFLPLLKLFNQKPCYRTLILIELI